MDTLNDDVSRSEAGPSTQRRSSGRGARIFVSSAVALALLAAAGVSTLRPRTSSTVRADTASPALPTVVVSTPLQREIEGRLGFLGQFSAVKRVELRAQVGGTLTEIGFKDGDVVHKGDLLFVIDPVPYEIKLSQGIAQLESADAQLDLAARKFKRREELKRTGAASAEEFDQWGMEKRAAQAAVNGARALIRDAQFDLDHCRITAPFTGRMGTHLVSVGNLIAGSRGGSNTTLLATIVSLDPIYLDFDMSELDYMTFARERARQKGPLADKLQVSLSDEKSSSRDGTLDFVDNTLDRSSGTIHARATVPNPGLLLTPGGFARVRLALPNPSSSLLVPDAAVLPDQAGYAVLTIGPDDVVTPKAVQLGDLRGGLRVIRSGLAPTDRVVINGVETTTPGSKVSPQAGSIRFGADQD
jgi:membrane fusion protein, multidrug efflux system